MSAFLIAARRTAVMPRGGAFAALDVHDLAAPVIRAVLEDAGLQATDVGELILSNALGAGGNPARVAALAAGLPERVAGLSIDRQCCGGLDAVLVARAMVASGQHDVVIAGGAESYSRRPLRAHQQAGGDPVPYDQPPFTPWPDCDPDMAAAADALGRKLGISRAAQDACAVDSHAKARAAAEGMAGTEIVPILGEVRDGFTRRLTPALCARAPVITGDITAANTAVEADGAAFVLVVSERIADRFAGAKLELLGGVTLGDDPSLPGLAPVAAIRASLAQCGVAVQDLQTAEIMEAYAVQALACQQGAGIAQEIVNRGGGALARGHPIGASGAILAGRLFSELSTCGGTGLAAIAAAGGLGTALVARLAD